MSTTQACAHVCTVNQKRLIPVTGRVGFADSEVEDRRFWIVDTRAPSDIPPPNALQLTEVLLPEISRSENLWWVEGGDGYYFWEGSGERLSVNRHFQDYELHHYPHRVGKWTARLNRKDEAGNEWSRITSCVLDDFGWLVEVSQC